MTEQSMVLAGLPEERSAEACETTEEEFMGQVNEFWWGTWDL